MNFRVTPEGVRLHFSSAGSPERGRLWAAFLVLSCALAPTHGQQTASPGFESSIEPIFHQRCYVCHGSAQQMNGLRLDSREAALRGGHSGPAIIPGDSARSQLIQRLTSGQEGFKMPLSGPPLRPAEINAIRSWIDGGARWPESAEVTRPSDSERASHWSFRPIRRPHPPNVETDSRVRNPIDRFILAKLEAEGVAPFPEADKITLVRRVYFDLLGLPPGPEQVVRFLADGRPEAYDELVEELLRSPHYGEKQAIHWLDAARYADSDGYERDPLRPHAWRWRHGVIDALNEDMPFDQFTIRQIAGDLLPNATLEDRVATGFLRNGIKNREAGVKKEEKRFEEIIDRVNTIGTVWLGLTVGCSQCHDHKYDPITQKDFYSMYALLNNAVERDIEAPLPGEAGPVLRAYPEYRAKREELLRENGIYELQPDWQRNIIEAMDNPGVNLDWDFRTTEWRAAHDRADWKMRADPSELTEIERDEMTDWFLGTPGPDVRKSEELTERFKKVREQLEGLQEKLPSMTRAYTMIERKQSVATHIALRGDWRSPGVEVRPGVPAFLSDLRPEPKPARLAFAQWLVSKDNPLTPRVTVNRMWQELFGRGFVRTSNDFGTRGERPSHAALLDWLAWEFVNNGWSRKHIIRLIATSATYRQSSNPRPELAERDPNNTWLARQNRLRLSAELLRDNALSVSGLLYPKVGGKSVRPPQPAGVAELSYSKKAWVEDEGPERYRRGLYIFFRRTSPYPMLLNFDAPTTLVSSVQREPSNSPLQALNLLNDPVFFETAQALAVRVVNEKWSFDDRLERMFRLCLSRGPRAKEKDRIATYFDRQKAIFEEESEVIKSVAPYVPSKTERLELAAWTGVARGLMNLYEFMTRE